MSSPTGFVEGLAVVDGAGASNNSSWGTPANGTHGSPSRPAVITNAVNNCVGGETSTNPVGGGDEIPLELSATTHRPNVIYQHFVDIASGPTEAHMTVGTCLPVVPSATDKTPRDLFPNNSSDGVVDAVTDPAEYDQLGLTHRNKLYGAAAAREAPMYDELKASLPENEYASAYQIKPQHTLTEVNDPANIYVAHRSESDPPDAQPAPPGAYAGLMGGWRRGPS